MICLRSRSMSRLEEIERAIIAAVTSGTSPEPIAFDIGAYRLRFVPGDTTDLRALGDGEWADLASRWLTGDLADPLAGENSAVDRFLRQCRAEISRIDGTGERLELAGHDIVSGVRQVFDGLNYG